MPKSISVSKSKTFHGCRLGFKYKYIDKYEMVTPYKDPVTTKGLVLHEAFERLLKYENYAGDNPMSLEELKVNRKVADTKAVMEAFKAAMEENAFGIEDAKNFRLKLGLKRWLSFKHDFLDKRNSILYAEKKYDEELFPGVNTVTILDLLEDNLDGTFTIYDYKTPQRANVSNYKAQVITYAYQMACVKGIIKVGSDDYDKVAEKFKLYIFFPLMEGDHEDYAPCLKPVKFTAEDVKKTIEELKQTCTDIDTCDFTKSAEVLQPAKMDNFTCRFCDYLGAAPQPEIGFEGCPISKFAGYKQKSLFKRPDAT